MDPGATMRPIELLLVEDTGDVRLTREALKDGKVWNHLLYITKPVDFERFIGVVRAVEEFWSTVVRLPQAGEAPCTFP